MRESQPSLVERKVESKKRSFSSDTSINYHTPKMSKPSVLVTNDDGINAPGLRALVSVLVNGGLCDVFVCAPQECVVYVTSLAYWYLKSFSPIEQRKISMCTFYHNSRAA